MEKRVETKKSKHEMKIEKAPPLMININKSSNKNNNATRRKLDTIYEDYDPKVGSSKNDHQMAKESNNNNNISKDALCGWLNSKLILEVKDNNNA
ncbi:hypothetical protein FRX31_010082 [Thalictrum thalictroides]|uniref:Uncharacterized protein n=1 Tax=Thalictrum thalictroides TaxID=46969 RepID=A0A7J6WTY1_THATH|nr:hypothetical protein FRX31_010082 [Thalictrum thalictroides]